MEAEDIHKEATSQLARTWRWASTTWDDPEQSPGSHLPGVHGAEATEHLRLRFRDQDLLQV